MYGVVLVDDEKLILRGLINVIPWEKYGCRVLDTASDGLEGIAKARACKPDILFTDIRMPNMDGLAMIAALKSEFPSMQIAVLTAFRDFDYAQRAMHLGVCRYLLKPSKMEEILEAVEAMAMQIPERPAEGTEAEAKESPASAFVVRAALSYIDRNYMNRLSLSTVADNVFVSQWHLSKLLNRHTGKSFFDIVNAVRVEKAKALLRDPSLKVHEIAEMVGFADVAHFSKIFKKLQRKSPIEYRADL